MEILFEDNHIIAVNKTTSDIVQVDKTGDQSLEEKVKAYIKLKYNKPGDVFLGVAHRIDRPVSGAVLFARTSKSLVRLNEMFQRKEVKKLYWAIVKEKPQSISDTLNHFIVRDQQKNKSYAFEKEGKDSKPASLTYTLIASAQNYHLLEIDLHTGRHHQIRCQLAKIGCPIKGDLKYGFPRSNPDGGISLHSRKIEFIHPVSKQPITIIANPPKDSLWDYFISITK
ncbi:MAG: RNA pseudouridine synthase [Bacteroidetes bacterium GWF2_33_16]|nr:MAG: RNA pseudouridine synthase [Bacteroidetes bacterium GWE2_32_14]OFY04862.1 MAG: RNA pseudouridine synthase [Bacteroidetes bacterium GWF2_33_16]